LHQRFDLYLRYEVLPYFAGEVLPYFAGEVLPYFAGEVLPYFAGEVLPYFAGEVLPYFAGKVLPYTDLPALAPAVTHLRRNAVQVSAGVWAGFASQAGECPSYFLRGPL